jgi:anti-sigma factor RsiW
MANCAFQSRVEAYHDGELSDKGRRAVEEHLARCGACAAELAWLRSISQSLVQRQSPDITTAELGGLHDAVDAAASAADLDLNQVSLYRMAGAQMAIAASVLVVSCVWLNELPAAAPGARPAAVAQAPAWERVAVTLRVDPVPNGLDSEVYLADARLADWMLRGLSGSPAHETR